MSILIELCQICGNIEGQPRDHQCSCKECGQEWMDDEPLCECKEE